MVVQSRHGLDDRLAGGGSIQAILYRVLPGSLGSSKIQSDCSFYSRIIGLDTRGPSPCIIP